ncbi:MAG: hypothetical protein KDC95_09805 [Planctomycetes bacterium]|nr:hypothetical protein [Planctomycetota bacterium]
MRLGLVDLLPQLVPEAGPSSLPASLALEDLEAVCFDPWGWSYRDTPIATQDSPRDGLVRTRYYDTDRVVRTHTLVWENPTEADRLTLRALFTTDLAVTSKQFRTTTPDGKRVVVTCTQPRSTLIAGLAKGSIQIELEEVLGSQDVPKRIVRMMWAPMFSFNPGNY